MSRVCGIRNSGDSGFSSSGSLGDVYFSITSGPSAPMEGNRLSVSSSEPPSPLLEQLNLSVDHLKDKSDDQIRSTLNLCEAEIKVFGKQIEGFLRSAVVALETTLETLQQNSETKKPLMDSSAALRTYHLPKEQIVALETKIKVLQELGYLSEVNLDGLLVKYEKGEKETEEKKRQLERLSFRLKEELERRKSASFSLGYKFLSNFGEKARNFYLNKDDYRRDALLELRYWFCSTMSSAIIVQAAMSAIVYSISGGSMTGLASLLAGLLPAFIVSAGLLPAAFFTIIIAMIVLAVFIKIYGSYTKIPIVQLDTYQI